MYLFIGEYHRLSFAESWLTVTAAWWTVLVRHSWSYSEVEHAEQTGPKDPELVFATVRPVGTPDGEFLKALRGGLLDYGYESQDIKLSELLNDRLIGRDEARVVTSEYQRIRDLMKEGDCLCIERKDAAAVANEGIRQLRTIRRTASRPDWSGEDEAKEVEALPRTAYIFDSLKRPAEIRQLRDIYGDRLIVLSLQSTLESRRGQLSDLITPHAAELDVGLTVEAAVENLMKLDLAETSLADVPGRDTHQYGQNMQRTFPMADVFVDVEVDVWKQVDRVLDRLFGSPDYDEPTVAEFGMHLAHISSTRSPELGLKVGAAILTDKSEVLSLGANVHPVPAGSPPYDTSALDIQELVLDLLKRLALSELSEAATAAIEKEGTAYVDRLLAGQLKGALVRDLTEFQTTVHAEMNALLDALRRGVAVEGATVYVTAFPCHNCAKHLVALGLQVRYIEPYPKSRAQSMYGERVSKSFLPFTGIAPRRYESLFAQVDEDRKNPDGTRKSWAGSDKKLAQPLVDPKVDQRGIADREDAAMTVEIADESEEPEVVGAVVDDDVEFTEQ